MSDIIHYNLDDIDKVGANFNIIFGERSNGKSYQVKHKKGVLLYLNGATSYHDLYYDKGNIIKESITKGRRFFLLRRYQEEIKSNFIEQYFADVDIEKITEGKYNMVTMYRGALYLSSYDFTSAKTTKGEKIGYIGSLSTEQNYAGGSYLDVTDIIFEEFMARSNNRFAPYLYDESNKLLNFYSTIDRKRGTTRVWMVGNSISQVCPYLKDWDIQDIILNMKQGEIKTKWIKTGDVDDNGVDVEVKIAMEFCKSTSKSSYVFGTHANMLNKGDWQRDIQPHLKGSYKDYKLLYRIGLEYKGFKWLGEYLLDNDSNTCWFIYPYKKEFKSNLLVFSDIIKTSRYYQRDIYNPSIRNENIIRILQTFKENKIFYSDDLSGTNFKQSIDFMIRK